MHPKATESETTEKILLFLSNLIKNNLKVYLFIIKMNNLKTMLLAA